MEKNILSRFVLNAAISIALCALVILSAFPAALHVQANLDEQRLQRNNNSVDETVSSLGTNGSSLYVPGEIIVKFTPAVGLEARKIFSEKRYFSEITHSSSFDDLNAKYQVTSMERVFQFLEKEGQSQGKEVMPFKEMVEQIKKQFPLRTQRASSDSTVSDLENVYLIKFNGDVDIFTAIKEYEKIPCVVYAEPNYRATLKWIPNDPYFYSSGSWGQPYADLWGLKIIGCEKAWDTSRGQGIVVAVIDSGLDYTHEDIHSNVWINQREIPGNQIDDDHNGYIDDSNGWNFVGNNPDINDKIGHGTHCSGIIAATGNNSIGVIGVAPLAQIMTLKILDLDNQGNPINAPVSEIAAAVEYAVANGADVISNSWGFNNQIRASDVQTIVDAINSAHSLGCIIVVASGNNNRDIGSEQFGDIPAALNNVITVGASDHIDQKADFSNFGVKLDGCAPGGDGGAGPSPYIYRNILSLRANGTDIYGDQASIVGTQYYRAEGTSMSCPHVSGLCALILSNHPAFTNEEVRQIIRASCDDIGAPGWDKETGYGRINASKALQFTSALTTHISSPKLNSFVNGTITITGTATGPDFQKYRVEYGIGVEPSSWNLITEQFTPVTNGNLAVNWTVSQIFSVITIRLTSFDTHGQEFFDRITVTRFSINITIGSVRGGFLGISAKLSNTGAETASNIVWSISVTGGTLGFVHTTSGGSLGTLSVGDTATIRTTTPILGFGRIGIKIQASSAETWTGTGFVFGPFIRGVTQT